MMWIIQKYKQRRFLKTALYEYQQALQTFKENRSRLRIMRDEGNDVARLYPSLAQGFPEKTAYAIKVCDSCINRLNTIIKTIEEKDLCRLKNQSIIVTNEINHYSKISNELVVQAQDIKDKICK